MNPQEPGVNMDPTRLSVNLSTHLDKASGEAWTSGVYQNSPCGCTVVGNGTSPHPLRVQHCAMHAALPVGQSAQFALLCTGVFADGKSTHAYQIVVSTDSETWAVAQQHGQNDPVARDAAIERLHAWRAR